MDCAYRTRLWGRRLSTTLAAVGEAMCDRRAWGPLVPLLCFASLHPVATSGSVPLPAVWTAGSRQGTITGYAARSQGAGVDAMCSRTRASRKTLYFSSSPGPADRAREHSTSRGSSVLCGGIARGYANGRRQPQMRESVGGRPRKVGGFATCGSAGIPARLPKMYGGYPKRRVHDKERVVGRVRAGCFNEN